LDRSAGRRARLPPDSAAKADDAALAKLDEGGGAASVTRAQQRKLAEVNRILASAEQALGDTTGLPRRPWFAHLVYAPGFYTGYGVKTMPGIREAVEQRRASEAQEIGRA